MQQHLSSRNIFVLGNVSAFSVESNSKGLAYILDTPPRKVQFPWDPFAEAGSSGYCPKSISCLLSMILLSTQNSRHSQLEMLALELGNKT